MTRQTRGCLAERLISVKAEAGGSDVQLNDRYRDRAGVLQGSVRTVKMLLIVLTINRPTPQRVSPIAMEGPV